MSHCPMYTIGGFEINDTLKKRVVELYDKGLRLAEIADMCNREKRHPAPLNVKHISHIAIACGCKKRLIRKNSKTYQKSTPREPTFSSKLSLVLDIASSNLSEDTKEKLLSNYLR